MSEIKTTFCYLCYLTNTDKFTVGQLTEGGEKLEYASQLSLYKIY